MKGRVIGVTLLCLLGAAPAAGETIVGGNIIEDTTWTLEGSPYIIEETTVEVRFESTLTIEPGVEVRFQPGRTLYVESASSIVAVGARGDSIIFTSNADVPAAGDWMRVELHNSAGSEFERCVFRYGKWGLYLNVSDPPVTSCLFGHCETGIHCQRSSPDLEDCTISATQHGILCFYRESQPTLYHCNLMDNGENIRLLDYASPMVTIWAQHNWWGTADEQEIEDSIWHDLDSGSIYGHVDYVPWLPAQPVEAATWGRIKAMFR